MGQHQLDEKVHLDQQNLAPAALLKGPPNEEVGLCLQLWGLSDTIWGSPGLSWLKRTYNEP